MGNLFSLYNIKKHNEKLIKQNSELKTQLESSEVYNASVVKNLDELEKDIKVYRQKTRKMYKLNELYKKILYSENEKTANIIMSSTLQLDYMDDAVEKKYICSILKAVYLMANDKKVTCVKKR